MESFYYIKFYFFQNGKPTIPVTGEFHFSSNSDIYLDESITKLNREKLI